MSIYRGFVLLGSLGKIWAKSRLYRNMFSSMSVLAYFMLMSEIDSYYNRKLIVPTISKPPKDKPLNLNFLQKEYEKYLSKIETKNT